MSEKFILCSQCNTKNRVPAGRTGSPKCGKCGKILEYGNNSIGAKPFLIVLVGVAVIGAGFFFASDKPSSQVKTPSRPVSTAAAPAPAEPVFDRPPVPISVGVVDQPRRRALAPLELRTSRGADYFVKIVDLSGQDVMTMYVVGGQTFQTDVPLGNYNLKYASGIIWYGKKYLFGPDTVYSKAVETFVFEETPDGYSGYTVELILQENGNLRTEDIREEEF